MKRKAKSGDIASFFAKKIQKSTQEEEREGNEGEGSKLERPGGSEQEKTEGDKEISDGEEEISEGDEEISEGDEEKEESVRDEEEAQDSERGTEAGRDQEEEDDRDEEGRPAIPPGPHVPCGSVNISKEMKKKENINVPWVMCEKLLPTKDTGCFFTFLLMSRISLPLDLLPTSACNISECWTPPHECLVPPSAIDMLSTIFRQDQM
ncbi:uncharacterized protein LOC130427597 [Triplophysa dalaica]|uniref:uncharacterized protein LOC130427597 n=1 Tax=Triplophysa dalaica TaxID=1582913 RepID=UPI0024DFD67C|nr:uncharacterized protein LOC130427597 [Triplophysa dalaica]